MPTAATIRAVLPPQLIHASRLIIATNRGPVEYYLTQDKTLKQRRGAGGMVTALIGAANSMEVTWVSMAMTEGDRITSKEWQQHSNGLLQTPQQEHKKEVPDEAIT